MFVVISLKGWCVNAAAEMDKQNVSIVSVCHQRLLICVFEIRESVDIGGPKGSNDKRIKTNYY